MFLSPGDVESENRDKLEFDDPLNENAMFLRSQGLQNEVKMVPKRDEKRKKSREEGKREQRSAKRSLESVLGALWGDILRFQGSPGEGRCSSRFFFGEHLERFGMIFYVVEVPRAPKGSPNGTRMDQEEEQEQRRSEKRTEVSQKCVCVRVRDSLRFQGSLGEGR